MRTLLRGQNGHFNIHQTADADGRTSRGRNFHIFCLGVESRHKPRCRYLFFRLFFYCHDRWGFFPLHLIEFRHEITIVDKQSEGRFGLRSYRCFLVIRVFSFGARGHQISAIFPLEAETSRREFSQSRLFAPLGA